MTSRPNRHLRRQLEAELRDESTFAISPPPANLLEKIRAGIPADLHAANEGVPIPAARRRFTSTARFRLAASIAVAVVGVTIGYRLLDRGAEPPQEPEAPAESPAKGAQLETSPTDLAEATPEARSENPPLKGETKDVGNGAETWSGSAKLQDDSRSELTGAAPEPLRKEAVAVPAGAPPIPPSRPSSSREQVAESTPLRSLGYLGGGVAGAVPTQEHGESSESSASAAAPAPASGVNEPWSVLQATPGTLVDRVQIGVDERAKAKQRDAVRIDQSAAEFSTGDNKLDALEEGARARAVGTPSPGGELEPNEQAADDMYFRPTETNPFVDTTEDRLSTFALEVDTGSWTVARSYLERGALPPREAIRVEEFINAQTYDDPAPRRGDFTLVAEGAPSPFSPGASYRLVRFAVKAREIDARDRKPSNLTFVVDVSGSMNRENRLGLVKRALGLLLDELGADDRVALVVYGTRGRVLLRHTRDLEAIREAIAALRPEGSTNAEEGLRFGYDLADEGWRKDSINRIILCSDGVANVGATGPESILARIGNEARRGIELTTVGFGMGNYNDALMEQLADQGDGSYHYVDSLDEARRIFVEKLTGTLQTVAKDAKAQVEFDPRVVDRWRLLGYENRDIADRDFRNDAVDAGEIGVGHSAVALYEVRLKEGARSGDPVGTLSLRWKSRATKHVEESALTLEVRDLEESFRDASANLRTAAVAAELGERLKGSFWAKEGSWSNLVHAAERIETSRRSGRTELVELVRRAAQLSGQLSGVSAPEPEGADPEREREEF